MILAAIELGLKDLSIFGIGGALGGIVGWVATILKTGKEIQKLEGEILKLAGEIVRDLQKSRQAYVEACSKTTQAARDLRVGITKNPNDLELINKLRDGLCDAFAEHAIPRHHDYCQWEALRLKGDPDKLYEFITDEVVFELRRFAKWLNSINAKPFLENLDREPLVINRRTLRPYYEIPLDLPTEKKQLAESILRIECAKLIEEG
ncbi:hypothetical protein [Luteolibacter sp. AS25]|uniref:hypothetical protein n=1 Tax=Luteolibacter sp. AS25 TaxID=3135776 RepID=UPI00398B030F